MSRLAALKSAVPWWGKIGLKLILARAPLSYRGFARLGVFRHGSMDTPDYALSVFRRHLAHAPDASWVGVEIGPGDTAFSAPLARCHGCRKLWLVDSGDYANQDPRLYREMARTLARDASLAGLPELCSVPDFAGLLANCGAAYLTDGVASLASIETASVDLVWSHAVLEHVRAADFPRLCQEMHRILRPGGQASHVVDFKDHLGGGLNNLRIPSSLWERDGFAQASGFYTNRIRFSAMRAMFEAAGFEVKVLLEKRWDPPPLRRSQLAAEFRGIAEEDLRVSDGHFLLRKPLRPSS